MLTVPSRSHRLRQWWMRAWAPIARVVKWQTRTFEGRMPQGVGVQVPPRAEMPTFKLLYLKNLRFTTLILS
jgi:hypothetical protein